DNIPDELRDLYDYIETGKKGNELTERIDAAVDKARKIEEWRSAYMKEMVLWMDAKEEGREEQRKNTEAERERADKEKERADKEKERADSAEAIVARYKAQFGELKD
ncbi:MAG: hypothetical protein IJ641_11220, partial [Lachnospiraceae bacterium]|nr:hypothetical protein [Lachnospiraceae bacterium]